MEHDVDPRAIYQQTIKSLNKYMDDSLKDIGNRSYDMHFRAGYSAAIFGMQNMIKLLVETNSLFGLPPNDIE